jgi:serine/threonine protein kinase
MSVDLRPYGLDWTLDPSSPQTYIPKKPKISTVARFGSTVYFGNLDGKTETSFTLGKLLGKGSYGATYSVSQTIDGSDLVIKIIEFVEESDLQNAILEFIIQLLCVEETKNETFDGFKGPFVPKVFMFGMDNYGFYIVSEKMDTTLYAALDEEKNQTDEFLRSSILQISKILDILYKKNRYSHRDFKADNIMIKYVNGISNIKLIDFGFSCMEYDGLRLNSDPSHLFHTCDKYSRDLSSLFYNLLNYSYLAELTDCPIKRILATLLVANGLPKDWLDQYPYYNTAEPNPNLRPENVYTIFKNLQVTKQKCGPIDASWATSIQLVNSNVLKFLEPRELTRLDDNTLIRSAELLSPEERSTLLSAISPNSSARKALSTGKSQLFGTSKQFTGTRKLLPNATRNNNVFILTPNNRMKPNNVNRKSFSPRGVTRRKRKNRRLGK